MQPNLDNVIDELQKNGVSNEDITKFVQIITNNLASQLYLMMVEVLTEDEIANLNTVVDDIERQTYLQNLIQQKTGKDLQKMADDYVKDFAKTFMVTLKDSKSQS